MHSPNQTASHSSAGPYPPSIHTIAGARITSQHAPWAAADEAARVQLARAAAAAWAADKARKDDILRRARALVMEGAAEVAAGGGAAAAAAVLAATLGPDGRLRLPPLAAPAQT